MTRCIALLVLLRSKVKLLGSCVSVWGVLFLLLAIHPSSATAFKARQLALSIGSRELRYAEQLQRNTFMRVNARVNN